MARRKTRQDKIIEYLKSIGSTSKHMDKIITEVDREIEDNGGYIEIDREDRHMMFLVHIGYLKKIPNTSKYTNKDITKNPIPFSQKINNQNFTITTKRNCKKENYKYTVKGKCLDTYSNGTPKSISIEITSTHKVSNKTTITYITFVIDKERYKGFKDVVSFFTKKVTKALNEFYTTEIKNNHYHLPNTIIVPKNYPIPYIISELGNLEITINNVEIADILDDLKSIKVVQDFVDNRPVTSTFYSISYTITRDKKKRNPNTPSSDFEPKVRAVTTNKGRLKLAGKISIKTNLDDTGNTIEIHGADSKTGKLLKMKIPFNHISVVANMLGFDRCTEISSKLNNLFRDPDVTKETKILHSL